MFTHFDKISIKVIGDLCDVLPEKALQQFVERCLIDEIIISNNIEGVHSSRKEIKDVFIDANQNGNNKRFKGLVQKYVLLQKKKNWILKVVKIYEICMMSWFILK